MEILKELFAVTVGTASYDFMRIIGKYKFLFIFFDIYKQINTLNEPLNSQFTKHYTFFLL